MNEILLKEKFKYYNRLSSLYFNAILLITGGMVGIIALNVSFLFKMILFVMAIWFDIVCISRHVEFNNLILKLFKGGM